MRRFLQMISEQTEDHDPEVARILHQIREIQQDADPADAEYYDAVLSQDWEGAERMVKSAANANGYNTGPLFHGTAQPRIDGGRIDLGRSGENYDGWSQLGNAFYTHTNKKSAQLHGQRGYTFPFFAKIDKPYRGSMGEFEDVGGDNQSKVEGLREKGHDAIIIDEVEGDQVALYVPEHIKYGGAVSQNFRGDVVPLSKRFNPKSGSVYQ